MPVQIPVPDVAYSTIEVSLAGKTYSFTFRFNTRMKKYENDKGTWILDISTSDGAVIIRGVAIIEQASLLQDLILDDFSDGDLFCFRAGETSLPPTRDNIGVDKDYLLTFVTNEELAENT